PRFHRLWALAAIAYVVISLFVGQMLLIYPASSPLDSRGIQTYVASQPDQIANPYLRPTVIVTAPHGVLSASLWPTLVMGLLGLGVGLAVASTVALAIRERRGRLDLASGGLGPVVAGWAFLGACCCSTCVAQVASVGLLGAAVGATPSELLRDSWPLGAVQLIVVGLSPLSLERRLEVRPSGCPPAQLPSAPRFVAAIVVRFA